MANSSVCGGSEATSSPAASCSSRSLRRCRHSASVMGDLVRPASSFVGARRAADAPAPLHVEPGGGGAEAAAAREVMNGRDMPAATDVGARRHPIRSAVATRVFIGL